MNKIECPYCGSDRYMWLETTTMSIPEAEIYRCQECWQTFDIPVEVIPRCGNCGDNEELS